MHRRQCLQRPCRIVGIAIHPALFVRERIDPDQSVRCLDLLEYKAAPHRASTGKAHAIHEFASGAKIELRDLDRTSPGPPPVLEVLGTGKGMPHLFEGGVEGAGQGKLPADGGASGGFNHFWGSLIDVSGFCVARALISFRYASRRSKLSSQKRRYSSTHPATSRSGPASSRQGRHCASRPRLISPARSSTFRCFETAGMLISNGLAS